MGDMDGWLDRPRDWATCDALEGLGICLSGTGNHKASAHIYVMGATVSLDALSKGRMHNGAGVAFRLEDRFLESEVQFLASVREILRLPRSDGTGQSPPTLDLNSPECSVVFGNLLTLYLHWRIRMGDSIPSPAEPWLCTLLARCGFAKYNPLWQAMINFYDRKVVLKGRSEEQAKLHLVEVFQCSNAECYRAKLLELRRAKGKKKSTWSPPLFPITPELERAISTKQSCQETALATYQFDDRSASLCCGGCGLDSAGSPLQFMRCARCLSVSYCSKDCQRSHWHVSHKNYCKQ